LILSWLFGGTLGETLTCFVALDFLWIYSRDWLLFGLSFIGGSPLRRYLQRFHHHNLLVFCDLYRKDPLTSDSFEINSEWIFKLLFQMNPLILKKYLCILWGITLSSQTICSHQNRCQSNIFGIHFIISTFIAFNTSTLTQHTILLTPQQAPMAAPTTMPPCGHSSAPQMFYSITKFLLNKNWISKAEQSQAFARGFQADLWYRIMHWLEIKLPDHDPDNFHPLFEIEKAAKHVLHGALHTTFLQPNATAIVPPAASSSPTTSIKTESICPDLSQGYRLSRNQTQTVWLHVQ
jgi:hypothetical protein